MEGKSLAVAILAIVVLASGCARLPSGKQDAAEKQGLKVTSFGITDGTLTPGQSAIIRLRLKNYHTEPIEIQKVSLYNTGFLQVSKNSCSPSNLRQARRGFAPEMKCSWEVTAPENLRGFQSRKVTLNLNLRYSSTLTSEANPLKVRFAKLSEIESRKDVSRKYSNGELSATVSLENPVPREGGIVSFRLRPVGPGRVASDYDISYRPSSVFTDCPQQVKSVSGERARFSCEVSSQSSSTRNLVFSTSYKYVKSPSLDVEVARP